MYLAMYRAKTIQSMPFSFKFQVECIFASWQQYHGIEKGQMCEFQFWLCCLLTMWHITSRVWAGVLCTGCSDAYSYDLTHRISWASVLGSVQELRCLCADIRCQRGNLQGEELGVGHPGLGLHSHQILPMWPYTSQFIILSLYFLLFFWANWHIIY